GGGAGGGGGGGGKSVGGSVGSRPARVGLGGIVSTSQPLPASRQCVRKPSHSFSTSGPPRTIWWGATLLGSGFGSRAMSIAVMGRGITRSLRKITLRCQFCPNGVEVFS